MDSDATKDNSTYKAVKSKSPSDTGADAFQEALLGKIGAVAQEMGTSNQVLNTLSSHMGTMTLQLGTLINFSMGAQAAHGTAGAVNGATGAAHGTAGAAPSTSMQITPSSDVDAHPHVGSGGSVGTKDWLLFCSCVRQLHFRTLVEESIPGPSICWDATDAIFIFVEFEFNLTLATTPLRWQPTLHLLCSELMLLQPGFL